MNHASLWSELEAHPLAGWMRAASGPLPEVDPEGRMLWCGIGGSWMPAEALVRALGGPGALARWVPLVSPEPMPLVLGRTDQLVFASRSGKTLELWTWIGRLRTLPGWGRWRRPPLVITREDGNPLARWAREERWPLLPIPETVGGRYSAFSPVGALPLAWMGRDPAAFFEAGRKVALEVAEARGHWGKRVWGTLDRLLETHGRGVHTWAFLTYTGGLEALGKWWVQLVAESLGKQRPDGFRIGLTPLAALGPQDQHSQLQRWIAGPRDLGVVLTTWAHHAFETPLDLPAACPCPGLEACTPLQILAAQVRGTHGALREAGVPVIHWHEAEGLTLEALASLMMAWQITVALLGLALGIDPFDQPAVEAGKRGTEHLLHLAGGEPARA
ncbi:MAG TPA: hypothetical protein VJ570_03330 [Holophagaceae bacterium]|nr:hypothetical protein [Holophagaceae bacterium]